MGAGMGYVHLSGECKPVTRIYNTKKTLDSACTSSACLSTGVIAAIHSVPLVLREGTMYPASRPAKLPGRRRCAEANLVLEGHETFYALYEPISSCKVQS